MTNSVKLSALVANDDGSSYNKTAHWAAAKDGSLMIVNNIYRTSISEGSPTVSFAGQAGLPVCSYKVNSQLYTIDQEQSGYDTRAEGHQWSNGLVAMNQYALEHSGFAGRRVTLAVGVPLEDYFSAEGGNPNEELVARKIKAFTESRIENKSDAKANITGVDNSRFVGVEHCTVLPEALGAYFSVMYDLNGNKRDVFPEDGNILIIDMGSHTTDVAVVTKGGRLVGKQIKTFKNRGFLHIYDLLRKELLRKNYGVNDVPTSMLEKAMKTNTIRIRMQQVNIAEEIKTVIDSVVPDMVNQIKIMMGEDLNFLSGIIAVGGGANIVKNNFGDLSQYIHIPEDPQYANANGFLLLLTYFMGFQVDADI